jgi:general stress protein 26
MTAKILDAAKTNTRILQMLDKSPFVSFATFGEGYPDVRVLLVVTKDGTDTIWFATETGSSKLEQLQKNPKVTLYGHDVKEMKEFRLFGSVELRVDPEARHKIWRDDLIQHFPGGINSPNMVILRFATAHGTYSDYLTETGRF